MTQPHHNLAITADNDDEESDNGDEQNNNQDVCSVDTELLQENNYEEDFERVLAIPPINSSSSQPTAALSPLIPATPSPPRPQQSPIVIEDTPPGTYQPSTNEVSIIRFDNYS